MDASMLKLYSVGYAAENKPLTTNDLKVFPVEKTPFVSGELNAVEEVLEAKGIDKNGNAYNDAVVKTTYITAIWLCRNSNRVTAPDIRRGERIIIWRYADTDLFYWESAGLDNVRRKLETVDYRFSDTRDESDENVTDDNSWTISVSTHEKHITIKTTKSDGEPYAYVFQINARDGSVVLTDDDSNYIMLDSANTRIVAENKDKSIIELDKTHIRAESVDTVDVTTKTYTLNAETINLNATTLNVETTTNNVTSTDTNITSTIAVTGNTTMEGSLGVTAGASITGGFSAAGGGSVAGGLDVKGGLKESDKDVGGTHTHDSTTGMPV